MGKYTGYMICTDLDGTFTEPPRNDDEVLYISRENLDAVRLFMKEGGIFTFSTGRRPGYIKESIFPFVKPNAPMITVNGASIYDQEKDEIIKSVFLPEKSLDAPFVAYREFRDKLEEVFVIAETEEFNLQFDDEDFLAKLENIMSLHDEWYKFVFRAVDAEATLEFQKFLQERYPFCYLPRSWETGQEILAKNATKGDRALELKKMFPQVHTLICVGDHENDIPMIEVADKGYAVKNAIDLVLQAADFVTVDFRESAIAKIISEI